MICRKRLSCVLGCVVVQLASHANVEMCLESLGLNKEKALK